MGNFDPRYILVFLFAVLLIQEGARLIIKNKLFSSIRQNILEVTSSFIQIGGGLGMLYVLYLLFNGNDAGFGVTLMALGVTMLSLGVANILKGIAYTRGHMEAGTVTDHFFRTILVLIIGGLVLAAGNQMRLSDLETQFVEEIHSHVIFAQVEGKLVIQNFLKEKVELDLGECVGRQTQFIDSKGRNAFVPAVRDLGTVTKEIDVDVELDPSESVSFEIEFLDYLEGPTDIFQKEQYKIDSSQPLESIACDKLVATTASRSADVSANIFSKIRFDVVQR